MGSEQSTQTGAAVRTGLRRGKSVPEYKIAAEDEKKLDGDAISPEQSVCSDSEIPYISYTVNRPIGESPVRKPRKLSRSKTISSPSLKKVKKKITPESVKGHQIVVVKNPALQVDKIEDSDLQKLKSIPMFLPIMRATLTVPGARDPEILERLDSTALRNISHLYQNYLRKCASEVSQKQNQLTKRIPEIDKQMNRVMAIYRERKKNYGKFAKSFGIVKDISMQVDKCQMLLNETLEMAKFLNDSLPDDDKLELVTINVA